MKRLFALLLFVASSTFAITGCGEADYSDIPEVNEAETEQKNAEIEKEIEAEMAKQAAGGGKK
ncbi:MAG: hypothetical protein P8K08_00825 [Fuerstiella sp.]|jgi:hypothetical protein|nr:hypothetical protein [Fuerstiella sp.]